jgi:predicted flavoprotein YhiN
VGRALRAQLASEGAAVLRVDLRPDLSTTEIAARLARRRTKDSLSKVLERSVGLTPVAIGLLREACDNVLPEDPDELARLVGDVPVRLAAAQPLDRAISTAGGVGLDQLDDSYMLRAAPGVFLAGEMLDWDAPTGGYLLQATFSTAVAAARGAVDWLRAPERG